MKNEKLMAEIEKEMHCWKVTASDAVNNINTFSYFENSNYVQFFEIINNEDPHLYYRLYVYSALDTGNIMIELSYKGNTIMVLTGIKKELVLCNVSSILKNLCKIFDWGETIAGLWYPAIFISRHMLLYTVMVDQLIYQYINDINMLVCLRECALECVKVRNKNKNKI